MRAQRGAAGAMILVIFAIVATVLAAASFLRKISDTSADRDASTALLEGAALALDAYVAGSARLPCPADPEDDGGLELLAGSKCKYPNGTLPWKTIGLSREKALDGWGRKISYRVFGSEGVVGGLIQTNGASMANCDTNEAFPSGVSANKLCKPDPPDNDPASRSTTPEQFLIGKGLKLKYFGLSLDPDNDALGKKPSEHTAYVLISHGPTGLGGYSASGVPLGPPGSTEERANMADTKSTASAQFVAMPFSSPEIAASDSKHFDDLVVYRTISDLAKRANLAARPWPDDVVAASTLNSATLKDALDVSHVANGDTGRSTIALNTVTISAFDGAGSSQNISFQSGGGATDGIGGVSGDEALASGTGGPDEMLRLDFAEEARRFAMSLQDFGYKESGGSPTWIERLEVRFFKVSGGAASLLGSVIKQGCRPDGGLASFSDIDSAGDFNRVEIRPFASTSAGGTTISSTFLLSEVRACKSGVACQTDLDVAQPASHCS
jgi:hypothetical protein